MNPLRQNRTLEIDIARLVDGELSPEERQAVFQRLEQDPEGWRRCALAFLEDQAIREGVKGWSSKRDEAPIPLNSRSGMSLNLLKIAASLLLAFTLGWSAKGERLVEVVREVPIKAGPIPSPAPAEPQQSAQPLQIAISDPEAEQKRAWELAGYSLQRVDRFVAVDNTGGQSVAVPVSEYSVEYIKNRTY